MNKPVWLPTVQERACCAAELASRSSTPAPGAVVIASVPASAMLLTLTLQLASIASAQSIFEETELHVQDALRISSSLESATGSGGDGAHDEAAVAALARASCHQLLGTTHHQSR